MSKRKRKPAAAPVVAEAEPALPEVGWSRARFEWWDAVWDRLPVEARRLYLDMITGVLEPPFEQDLPGLEQLIANGLLSIDPDGLGLPQPTLEFARRMVALDTYDVLEDEDVLVDLINVSADPRRLPKTALEAFPRLLKPVADPAAHLAEHVASPDWAPAALRGVHAPGAVRLLELLRGAGVLRQAEVRRQLGPLATAAIDDLVGALVAFEGIDDADHGLVLGVLPGLRRRGREAAAGAVLHGAPAAPPAPLHQPSPKKAASGKAKRAAPEPASTTPALADLGADDGPPPRPWLVDDLEALLVHVAHERCRLTRYQGLYVEDQARLEAALVAAAPGGEARVRASLALELAHDLELVERKGSTTEVLRPRASAAAWLERPLAERWRAVVEALRDDERRRRRWLGGHLDMLAERVGRWPPRKDAVKGLVAPLAELAPGRRYALAELVRRAGGEQNPLVQMFLDRLEGLGQGRPTGESLTRAVRSHLRWVIPEVDLQRVDAADGLTEAWRRGVATMLRQLVTVGGARVTPGPTDHDATFSLTAVGRFYLGFTDAFPADPLPGDGPAKVVVQPNLEVVLIGRAPAALVRLALLAERQADEHGPARTLRLSRERVVESIARGATPDELEAALDAAAGGAPIPDNVRRTVRDWARAVKRVRLVHVPVLLTDDEETALTARSIAGKGVVLPGHVVPVDPKRLSAFRKALQKRGVVVDDGPLPAEDD